MIDKNQCVSIEGKYKPRSVRKTTQGFRGNA